MIANPDPVPGPAAQAAVDAARAASLFGTTQAKLAYSLTSKAVKESDAEVVFPLIVLSLTSVSEGLLAFGAISVAADAATHSHSPV